MRNRLLLIIINANKKTGRTSHIVIERVEDKRPHNVTNRLVIREEYNYSDANNIPYSDQEMTIKIEHD